jgi:hypothetical protein
LDVVKHNIIFFDLLEQILDMANFEHILYIPALVDGLPPIVINAFEAFALLYQLLSNVRRLEDGLQVHPIHLELYPFFY